MTPQEEAEYDKYLMSIRANEEKKSKDPDTYAGGAGRFNQNGSPAPADDAIKEALANMQSKVQQQENPARVLAAPTMDYTQARGTARNKAMGLPGELEAIKGSTFTQGPRAGNNAEIAQELRNNAIMDAFYRASQGTAPTYAMTTQHVPGERVGSYRKTDLPGYDIVARTMIDPGQSAAKASQEALKGIGAAMHGAGTPESVSKTQAEVNNLDMKTALAPDTAEAINKYHLAMANQSKNAYDALGEAMRIASTNPEMLSPYQKNLLDDFHKKPNMYGSGSPNVSPIAKPGQEPIDYSNLEQPSTTVQDWQNSLYEEELRRKKKLKLNDALEFPFFQ